MGCVFCHWWRTWFPLTEKTPAHDCFYDRLREGR